MKTILYAFIALFIGLNVTSCTPTNISDTAAPQACCDQEGDIPPPPPPTGNGG